MREHGENKPRAVRVVKILVLERRSIDRVTPVPIPLRDIAPLGDETRDDSWGGNSRSARGAVGRRLPSHANQWERG